MSLAGSFEAGAAMMRMAWMLAVVMLAMAPGAQAAGVNLPISVSPTDCRDVDGKGRPAFFYTVRWNAPGSAPTEFIVNASAACKMEMVDGTGRAVKQPCSGGGVECVKVCRGVCQVELTNCTTSVKSWAQVSTRGQGLVSKRELATAPAGKCLKPAS
ncbi:hypothetical protein [Phenylobacterium sp.]|uniref:hypothetical protein n=1 Tax=Phenylobacterium sp. TaxID=1871053 RepID=UPI00286B85EF|nr:hypothetical protein [Phenylobacterium sp.]